MNFIDWIKNMAGTEVDTNLVPPVQQNTTQPPVQQNTTQQPPVQQNTTQPPVQQNTTQQPPVQQNTTQQPPVQQNTTQQPPTQQTMADLQAMLLQQQAEIAALKANNMQLATMANTRPNTTTGFDNIIKANFGEYFPDVARK